MTDTNTVALATGMLTLAQTAEQLASALPDWCGSISTPDATIYARRLIARGAIEGVRFGVEVRVPIDSLSAYIRDGGKARGVAGLPAETIAPLFGVEGDWLGLPWPSALESFRVAVHEELLRQMPASVEWNGGQLVTVAAKMTPELKTILSWEAPTFPFGFDTSAFKGIAEIYLAHRLASWAEQEIQQRPNAHAFPSAARRLSALYESPEAYQAIVASARATLERFPESPVLATGKARAVNAPVGRQYFDGRPAESYEVPVKVVLSDAAIMAAIGSTSERISRLAF